MNQFNIPHHQPPTERGFTLIELMIVVAVIGILSAIAYPSYVQYVLKTRRATAGACLMEAAQWMERNYTTCLAYDKTGSSCSDDTDSIGLPTTACITDLSGAYTFSIAASPAITSTTYQLNAAPQGSQASDTKCGTLTIDQTGAKGADATSGCWN